MTLYNLSKVDNCIQNTSIFISKLERKFIPQNGETLSLHWKLLHDDLTFVQGKVGSRNRNIDLENAMKMANSDGMVTYEEIRQNLKK